MAVLDYPGYSTLVGQTWNADSGSFYANGINMQFTEQIIFGAETIFVGYKHIACQYKVKDSILNGYLYVPESLATKFIFGDAEKPNGNFDVTGAVLLIYTTNANIYIKYVP